MATTSYKFRLCDVSISLSVQNLINSIMLCSIVAVANPLDAQNNGFVLKGSIFGIGGGVAIQQSKFIDTDFTGISDFSYVRRVQWLCEVKFKYMEGNRWSLGLSSGIREAGWNRVENSTGLEPYDIERKYNLNYVFADASVGYMPSRFLTGLNVIAGLQQFYNVRFRETVLFSDGSKEISTSSAIVPNKHVTAVYAGLEYRITHSKFLILTTEYKCTFGINKFHKDIIDGTQAHHVLTLNLYPCFK